jgi:signal recognition particle subunit SRP19
MGKNKGGVRIKQVGPKQPAMPVNPMEGLQIPTDEMVHLPPPPDRSYKLFWPMHETFSMDTTGFQVIYPSYLDSTKTIKKGRRIGAEKAVETPTVMDLSQAVQSMQIRHVIQPYKGYSRDTACQWDNPGRILVDVSNYKKKELLHELAIRLPILPDRIARLEREKMEKEETEKVRAEAAAAAAAAVKSQPKKIIGKKGKKGKKK